MAWSKIEGFEVSPVTEKIVDVTAQRPTRQQPSRDVVKPKALAQVVELLRRLHGTLLNEGMGSCLQVL